MKKTLLLAVVISLWTCSILTAPVAASPITLAEYAANIDGTTSYKPGVVDPVPSGMNISGFDTDTGLGTISLTIGGAGTHYAALFVDHEIDEAINTFFNEYGNAVGTPAAGQSWEIDEPGWVFGDIYDNFLASSLDNSNGVPSTAPDDVSMAIGWNFSLVAGESANIEWLISETIPTGFYLQQTDPDSAKSIYFSSNLEITGKVIPAPDALILVSIGMGLVDCLRRHKKL